MKEDKTMKFESEYIEKLAKIINEQDLTEISLEDGEQAITIRRDVVVTSAPVVSAPVVAAAPAQTAHAPQASKEEHKSEKPASKGTPITSPMVGTFYMAPSPDSAPFVSMGGNVKQGDVVCIIEAMKMMNEIKSEITGKIVEICVEDGQPVEFGQVLMYVE